MVYFMEYRTRFFRTPRIIWFKDQALTFLPTNFSVITTKLTKAIKLVLL